MEVNRRGSRVVVQAHATRAWCPMPRRHARIKWPRTHDAAPHTNHALTDQAQVRRLGRPAHRHRVAPSAVEGGHPHEWLGTYGIGWRTVLYSRVNVWTVGRTPAHAAQRDQRASRQRAILRYGSRFNRSRKLHVGGNPRSTGSPIRSTGSPMGDATCRIGLSYGRKHRTPQTMTERHQVT